MRCRWTRDDDKEKELHILINIIVIRPKGMRERAAGLEEQRQGFERRIREADDRELLHRRDGGDGADVVEPDMQQQPEGDDDDPLKEWVR